MNESQVSIGRVKREISTLLNRVAYGGERIVLTSRGKPKAVIVSLDDYQRIQQAESRAQLNKWKSWLEKNDALTERILAERGGKYLDSKKILAENRENLEERHDYLFDS